MQRDGGSNKKWNGQGRRCPEGHPATFMRCVLGYGHAGAHDFPSPPPGRWDERVGELRAWANSRIEWCRREEQKFGAGNIGIEAATERRALQAVLRILNGEETPHAA